MVLLAGLEIAAAGYLIHRHQKNKREKRERREEERIALEEEEYGRYHRRSHSRHRRSPSSDRCDSRDRARSQDRIRSHRPKSQRDSPKRDSHSVAPPRYEANYAPQSAAPPRDVKYGWSDDVQTAVQDDLYFPPTGWPQHWAQTRQPEPGSIPLDNQPVQGRQRRREASRGRSETRTSQSAVYDAPRRNRGEPREFERASWSRPPPSYRS